MICSIDNKCEYQNQCTISAAQTWQTMTDTVSSKQQIQDITIAHTIA